MDNSFALTIARVADPGKIAAKRIGPQGTIADYDNVFKWRFSTARLETPEDIAAALLRLADDPNSAIIYGALKPGLNPNAEHRRMKNEPDATIGAVPRRVLILDIDGEDAPIDGYDAPNKLREAAIYIRDGVLPPKSFYGVRMVATVTASTGFKKGKVRLRLYALLDRPVAIDALKTWAENLRLRGVAIDQSIYSANQPIYTARPIFEGIDDPVPRDERVVILPGRSDVVELDLNDMDNRDVVINGDGAAYSSNIDFSDCTMEDWQEGLKCFVGGRFGIHEPLKKFVGLAVRNEPNDDIILQVCLDVIKANKRDESDLKTYNARKIRAMIRDFRRADERKQQAKAGNGKTAPISDTLGDSEGDKALDGNPLNAPQFSEDQLALDFTKRHGENLRYVAAWGKWYQWTGTYWLRENTLAAYDLARKICREAAAICNKPGEAKSLAKAKTTAAVEQLARSDRNLAAIIDQWDSNPWLLNTPEGTVDLKNGKLQRHLRADYCTKITAVSPGGTCPKFFEFLNTIFNNDQKLIAYLQKVLGYCLTGNTREHD